MKNVKSVANLTHNIKVFYLSAVLKGIAITMPHAILTLIFLSKGISYSQIAIIQAAYSIATIIFEFPSGVLADKYRKKTIFVISNVIMLFSYLIVLFFDSFYMLAFAWLIYGISNAFETGTIDSHIIISIKKIYDTSEAPIKMEKFIGIGNSLSAIASIVGAGVGFFLYQFINVNVYYIMLMLMLISGLLVLFHYRHIKVDNERENIHVTQLVKETFLELRSSAVLRWIIAAFGILQMYLQVHFQLWQSYFLELGYNENIFLGLYLLFQIITVVVYKLPVSKLLKKYMNVFTVLGIISAIILFGASNKIVIVILYCIPVVLMLMFQYFLEIVYSIKVKEENISALTSLKSTVMRVFSSITLLLASAIINIFSLKILYFVFATITIVVVAPIIKKSFNFMCNNKNDNLPCYIEAEHQ